QKGNSALERGAAVIRQSLEPLGIDVDVVALEVGALVARFMRGDYDAAYFRLLTTDTDPALNLDFWLSSGSAHVWNPAHFAPATGARVLHAAPAAVRPPILWNPAPIAVAAEDR